MCFLIYVSRRATIIQHQNLKTGQVSHGSVALPAVLRSGETGQNQITVGSMQKAQYSHVSNQAHAGHVPSIPVSVYSLHGPLHAVPP